MLRFQTNLKRVETGVPLRNGHRTEGRLAARHAAVCHRLVIPFGKFHGETPVLVGKAESEVSVNEVTYLPSAS